MSLSNLLSRRAKTPEFIVKSLLLPVITGGVLLRLCFIDTLIPFFSDQDWFYKSAVESVQNGRFPLLGITTSITWLHQGPFWTYLLIPGLTISDFHPLSGTIFIVLLNLMYLPLIYFGSVKMFNLKTGLIATFMSAFFHSFIVQSRIAYHTSPIPIFVLLTLLLLLSRRHFLSGFFLGLLFQLHLLTFVYWPPAFILAYRFGKSPFPFLLGLILGLTPFFISGPVQSFGVFAWMAKFALGQSGTSGISVAYQMVFLTPVILISSAILAKFSNLVVTIALFIFLIVNLNLLIQTGYQTLSEPTFPEVIAGSSPAQDSYIHWWRQRKMQP